VLFKDEKWKMLFFFFLKFFSYILFFKITIEFVNSY
jgi:hypothetical protein